MESKTCSVCGIEKPLDQFYGRVKQSQCAECRKASAAAERREKGVPERRANFVDESNKRCPNCGKIKPLTEFYRRNEKDREGQYKSKCAECLRTKAENVRRKRGVKPYSENTKCSMYLGIAIAEEYLATYFKHVERMPPCHKSWDFVCDKGFKIDVKASTRHYRNAKLKKSTDKLEGWQFYINNNEEADYFLCIAYDTRESLNPEHLWLIPGKEINMLKYATISETTISKWSQWERPVKSRNQLKQEV